MENFINVLISIMAFIGIMVTGLVFWVLNTSEFKDRENWCECTKCGDKHPSFDFDVENDDLGAS